MHRNKINQKVYIGQTSQTVENRWRNGYGYFSQKEFYSDIQKYGWDNFEHNILEIVQDQELANEREKYYIELYNARNKEFGYNIALGGSNVSGENNPMFGKKHSEETKKKMSLIASNRSLEAHKKMSEAAKRRVERDGAPFQGKHLSEEAKEKLRQVDKSYTQTPEYREKMSKATSGGKNGQAIPLKAINATTGDVLYFECKKYALNFLNLSYWGLKALNKAIKEHTIYRNYYWEVNKDE